LPSETPCVSGPVVKAMAAGLDVSGASEVSALCVAAPRRRVPAPRADQPTKFVPGWDDLSIDAFYERGPRRAVPLSFARQAALKVDSVAPGDRAKELSDVARPKPENSCNGPRGVRGSERRP
jgi:hypothetical protein